MAQDVIKINGFKIRQPDEGELGYGFETTYSADTTRTQKGVLIPTALFTVEALTYSASFVPAYDVKTLLGFVATGKTFTLHYFSPYYGMWRDDKFYVGQGKLSIRRLDTQKEMFENITFQMTGVNPL